MTETGTTDETPADRWDMPPEPKPGTVLAGSTGVVYRREPERGWRRTDSTNRLGWHQVLADAPLVRLVPADEPRDDGPALVERDELLRTVDGLRNTLARYRGTTAMHAAARRVVDTSGVAQMDAIYALRRLLDEPTEPRTVTYDRSEDPTAGRATSALRRGVVRAARRVLDAVDAGTHTTPALADLRGAVRALDDHTGEAV